MADTLSLFEMTSKVVDLAMYRAAHPRPEKMPPAVFDRTPKPVNARHRQLMLTHLATQTRVAVGGRD